MLKPRLLKTFVPLLVRHKTETGLRGMKVHRWPRVCICVKGPTHRCCAAGGTLLVVSYTLHSLVNVSAERVTYE